MPPQIVPDPVAALPLGAVMPSVHRDLHALWLKKASPGRLPGRADFEPREMPRLLPHITLFDVEREPLRFRVRLVGTAIVEATGIDGTGGYVDELADIEQTLARCRALVETGRPYFHADLPLMWSPRHYKTYSVLGLPLAADGRNVDKILGALTFG
jgi:hypothetical protein